MARKLDLVRLHELLSQGYSAAQIASEYKLTQEELQNIARPPMRGMRGRAIHGEHVFKYAAVGIPQQEIADLLRTTVSDITTRFAVELRAGRAQYKLALRQKQFQKAVTDGNTAMLIFLGKQDLGQSEKTETKTPDLMPPPVFGFEFDDGGPGIGYSDEMNSHVRDDDDVMG